MMQTNLAGRLAQEIQQRKTAHAYLFVGGLADEQALYFAMALNCQDSEGGYPCGSCSSCRKIAGGNFVDCYFFAPDDKDSIKIEQMRKLQHDAASLPIEGSCKVFIIKNAEKLQVEAANSLLKILEEPPLNTVFILTAANSDKLLSTIVSRCRVYFFQAADDGVTAASSDDQLPAARALLLALSSQKVSDLLLFAASFDKPKDRDNLLSLQLALWQLLADSAAGRSDLHLDRRAALKAALFTERAINLTGGNVNLRLMADVFFLRLQGFFSTKD